MARALLPQAADQLRELLLVNRVDRDGNNVFEGGFLGLDNITVIDRSEPTSDGSQLVQSDATGWMGMFCLNLMRIALELAKENKVYEGLATKFLQHYTYVAHAMKHMGDRDFSLFDQDDGFFYDALEYPDGSFRKFRVRSMVGLIPLFAVRSASSWRSRIDAVQRSSPANLKWFLANRRELTDEVVHQITGASGDLTYLLTIVNIAAISIACSSTMYDEARVSVDVTASGRSRSSTRSTRSSSTGAPSATSRRSRRAS